MVAEFTLRADLVESNGMPSVESQGPVSFDVDRTVASFQDELRPAFFQLQGEVVACVATPPLAVVQYQTVGVWETNIKNDRYPCGNTDVLTRYKYCVQNDNVGKVRGIEIDI